MARGYDSTGATVGAAGHDAVQLLAALITAGATQDSIEEAEELAFASWQRLRDRILDDSLAKQDELAADKSSYPKGEGEGGDYHLPWGKHKGLTLAEIHATSGEDGKQDGASYLTWVVANSDDKAAVAQVKAFLASLM